MGISVNFAMLNKITDDTSDGWSGSTITYSIGVDHGNLLQDIKEFLDWTFDPNVIATPAANIPMFIDAIRLWDDLIAKDIVFQDQDGNADITINTADNFKPNVGASTYSTMHTIYPNDEDIFVDAKPLSLASSAGKIAWGNLLHEFGHALGLQHPGDYNASEDSAPTYANDRDYNEDTVQFSIMSYFSPENLDPTINWTRGGNHPQTPMVYDIMAIQAYYGTDTTTRTGDTTYGFHSSAGHQVYDFTINTQPVITIWDAGGADDRLDASGFAANPNQRIDLGEGSYSDIGGLIQNVGIAFGVTIEHAVGGGGNDTITGNAAANKLTGNAGDDQLTGGSGDDTLDGGAGVDTLHGGQDNDTLTGGSENDNLFGEFGIDHLDGSAGEDILDGGGSLNGAGGPGTTPDELTGGSEDDTFVYRTGYRATVINDFTQVEGGANDRLDVSNTPAHSFAELLARGTQQGADAVFNFGNGDVLTLKDVSLDALEPVGFTFADLASAPGDFVIDNYNNHEVSGYGARTFPLDHGGFIEVERKAPFLGLIAQRFDSRGAPIDTFTLNTTPLVGVAYDYGPGFAKLNDGRIVAAWDHYSDPGGNTGRSIRAIILSPDGTPTGEDFQVNTTPPVVQDEYIFPFFYRLIAVKALDDGGFYIDWYADDDPDPSYSVLTAIHHHRRTYDMNGNPLGPDQDLANTNLVYPPDYPDADVDHYLTLKSGAVLHTWWQNVPNLDTTYGPTVKAAHAEIVGITPPIRLDHIIIEPKGGEINELRASELDDGRIVFTWLQNSAQLPLYPGDTQALILNSDLHGFTRPGTPDDDTLEGSIYNDRLFGLEGNDTLIGNLGPDILDGGPGTDTADYRNSLSGVDVSLGRVGLFQSGGHAQGDELRSIENLTGSAYGDVLTGDDEPNVIHGSYGNDSISGGGGTDTLYGDQGKDTITVREDASALVYGGKGGDTIKVLGSGSIAYGESGDDDFLISGDGNTAYGGLNVDTFSVAGSGNTAFGDEAGDTLLIDPTAGSGNRLIGGAGDDTLRVVGGASGNFLDGGPDTDVLTGGASRDFLDGGPGDDRLRGGQSADTFAWVAGGGTDTITDFNKAEGDKIDLSQSGIAKFGDLTITQDGPDTVIALGDDSLRLWDVNLKALMPHDFIFASTPTPVHAAANDVNGDRKADILFTHNGGAFSSIYEWQMNNRAVDAQGGVDLYDPSFSTLAAGDFNGDGKSDLLFQNPATGGVWQWQLDGTTIIAQGAVDVGDPTFHLLGTADFSGDGKDDVLFRDDAGLIYMWQMNGFTDTPRPVGPLDPSWQLQGTGDFDGDGKADLIMRKVGGPLNENGAYYICGMDGNAIVWEGGVDRPDPTWHTLGLGDFNGDGQTDLALRNQSASGDNGAVWIWLLSGHTILGQGAAGIADPATWHLAEIGDFNGDGKDDILYRDNAGHFYNWDMNGTTIASEAGVPWADPSFAVVEDRWEVV